MGGNLVKALGQSNEIYGLDIVAPEKEGVVKTDVYKRQIQSCHWTSGTWNFSFGGTLYDGTVGNVCLYLIAAKCI